MPPQVSPTANADSSLTPYRCRTGSPEDSTCSPSSYTAPSTQPPDTLPTASPPGPTSIDPATFRGPALIVIAFGQYVVPLAVLEGYLRAKTSDATAPRVAMALMLALLTLALLVGIAAAGLMLWLPRIV